MINNIKYKKYWRKTSLKQEGIGDSFLKLIIEKRPKNFLEIGVFHGVTSRNVCELLNNIHEGDFKFTGIDLFMSESEIDKDEFAPNTNFSNPLKKFYYKYIKQMDPYSIESVQNLLKKFKKNIEIIKGNSNEILPKINVNNFDYVFVDGGHKYETVLFDLKSLTKVIENKGVILCDDYNLTYAPGIKKAIF